MQIGVGDTYEAAAENLEGTPIQSCGMDSRMGRALAWAEDAGWISTVDLDDDDGPDEEDECS